MSLPVVPVERFPALQGQPNIHHAFIGRVPGVDVTHDKGETLRRLDAVHRATRDQISGDPLAFLTAEQVHGNEVALIEQPVRSDRCFAGVDGLLTDRADVWLGIYVADCCAVYLVDGQKGVIGLIHSGKRGTEGGIVAEAVTRFRENFGSAPEDIVAQLSPCIRPPHYEVDFAAEIRRQLAATGVREVHDCGTSTAADLRRYYSYRMEKGKTGRMLALLARVS